MNNYQMGFIGGGRITSIFLNVLTKSYIKQNQIIVSDNNESTLNNLKSTYPEIDITNENPRAATADYVFISLHPPVIVDVLKSLIDSLTNNSVVISLAPKLTVQKISSALNGFNRIVRAIPNSPSIISEGYNSIYFSEIFTSEEVGKILTMFQEFGEYKIVEEEHLEAYALIAAMGPTYLQFQLNKLFELAQQFGVDKEEAGNMVFKMVDGINKLLFKSNFTYEEILDLIPVKPLKDNEEEILSIYDSKLTALYEKLTEGK